MVAHPLVARERGVSAPTNPEDAEMRARYVWQRQRDGYKRAVGFAKALDIANSAPRMWQDLARTIPATKPGDPVAVWEDEFGSIMEQADPSRRPTRARLPWWSRALYAARRLLARLKGWRRA